MSELDFEAEITSVETHEPSLNTENSSENIIISCSGESTIDSLDTCSSKKQLTHADADKKEIDPLVVKDQLLSSDNKQSDSGKETDVEEGEISDSTLEDNNQVICKFVQAGKCRYGSNCRFIHPGVSAYKMFDTLPSNNVDPSVADSLNQLPSNLRHRSLVQVPPLLSRYLHDMNNTPDDWEKGLQIAKQLVLRAKDKKDNDMEFEEKKLYMSIPVDKVQPVKKISISLKADVESRSKKRCRSSLINTETDFHKSQVKTKHMLKKRKIDSPKSKQQSSQSWVDPWRRSRSRTRNISGSDSSWSSLSLPYRKSYSSCSCSSENCFYESRKSREKSKSPKQKSKLDRVFARTLCDSPSKRKRMSGSRSSSGSWRSPPHLAEKKRPLPSSFSRSPEFSKRSKKLSDAKNDAKRFLKAPISPKIKSMQNEQLKRRDVESFDRKSKYSWNSDSESSGSDISSLSSSWHSAENNGKLSTVKFALKKPDKKMLHNDKVFSKSSSSDSFMKNNYKDNQVIDKRESKIPEKSTQKFSVKNKGDNSSSENLKSVQKQTKVIKKISADEQQLLRFANVDENVNLAKTNLTEEKKPVITGLKSNIDNAGNSNKILKAASKNKKESRKEMLIKQLKEVERAIAKKKNLIP